VRIDGVVGIGDSLAVALQPASPCRGLHAEYMRKPTAASNRRSARRATV